MSVKSETDVQYGLAVMGWNYLRGISVSLHDVLYDLILITRVSKIFKKIISFLNI